MKKLTCLFCLVLLTIFAVAQQSYNITFVHDGKTVYGTFTTPNGSAKFPTVIISPGSGAIDRDGTILMVGDNIACLYPALLNSTLQMYKELSDALVDSGYAVLRYDKLEYTYPTTLGTITFHKLWLPVESAINYLKTRNDVDTSRIILIGHSEGSYLIPFIAKSRTDIKALISIAGARTPLDSLIAYQLIYIAQTCNGDTVLAQAQANQILSYFNIIRTNIWDNNTPPLFGVPASAWYDYVLAVDSVAINYNLSNLPSLFTGMGLDINVPPTELIRLQNEVTITNDFWSIPGLIHYMTPNNVPHVSEVLTDTIIYWLRQHNFATGINNNDPDSYFIQTYPNPFNDHLFLTIKKQAMKNVSVTVHNIFGQTIFRTQENNPGNSFTKTIDFSNHPGGVYLIEVSIDSIRAIKSVVRELK